MSRSNRTLGHLTRKRIPWQEDRYLLAVALSVVVVMALIYQGDRAVFPVPGLRPYLAFVPIAVAAYGPRGQSAAQLTAAFFGLAWLPWIISTWNTPAFPAATLAFVSYVVVLGLMAYLASSIAAFLRTRMTLSDALRDWEELLARAANFSEVTTFLVDQAKIISPGNDAWLVLRNPLDEHWEVTDGQMTTAVGTGAMPYLSLPQWLIEEGKAQWLVDVANDPRFVLPPDVSELDLSFWAEPIQPTEAELLGLLVLASSENQAPLGQQMKILRELSDAGGQALVQAGLYAQTSQALRQRIQQLGSIQQVAQELNASLEASEIAELALTYAQRLSGAEGGLVGIHAERLDDALATSVEPATSQSIPMPIRRAQWIERARLDETVTASDPSLLPEARSRLLAPIRREGRWLGTIVLESPRLHAFGPDTLQLIDTLTDHVAVAVENARLFAEITEEQEKSAQIIETMADALLTTDDEAHILTANPAAVSLTGWPVEQMLGRTCCQVLGYEERLAEGKPCPALIALAEQRVVQEESLVIRQHLGTQRVVTLSAAPLLIGENKAMGLVILIRDVTEQREMEKLQQNLIAGLSHELRTPLTSIRVLGDTLLQSATGLDDGQREQLLLLQAQSDRLVAFADRMLELARLEAGEISLDLRPLPLDFLALEVVKHWQPRLVTHTLILQEPEGPVWVWGDEQALTLVLDTLIDNAAKYTPADQTIKLSIMLESQGHAIMTIQDQGSGIAPEHQSKVFERFYRVDGGDAQEVYGHGLGLSVAKGLVEAMGGEIWLESEPGQGSSFSFSLPGIWEANLENPGYRR